MDLPPWAEDADQFVKINRDALESPQVSRTLPFWIDLIFGVKQQGEEALKANNLFYPLTYEGAVDIESVLDPHERASLESQIHEFGQTPRQIFFLPHLPRLVFSSFFCQNCLFCCFVFSFGIVVVPFIYSLSYSSFSLLFRAIYHLI